MTFTQEGTRRTVAVKTEAAGDLSLAYYEADARGDDSGKAERLPLGLEVRIRL